MVKNKWVLGTDGTFTSAKESAAAAGFSDLASIGIFENNEYAYYGLQLCEFKCPYPERFLRSWLKFQSAMIKPLKSTGEVVPTFGSGEECADDVNFNLCCSYSKYNSWCWLKWA